MKNYAAFTEQVAMKFQIYNGLFLNLPFPDVKSSGILLPVFTSFCQTGLEEEGRSPLELVEEFFHRRVGAESFREVKDDLFRFLRLAERQVVLFDAIEDAAFTSIVDQQGPGSIKDSLNRIEGAEDLDRYWDLLRDYRVRVVLTAHPTQFYTDQILGVLSDLVDGLNKNNINRINDLLLQMGNTRFKKKQKPSPLDEAQSLIWTLENVMFEVIPAIHAQLTGGISSDPTGALDMPAIVELGFWPGGDRDGNPFVSPEITRQVGNLLRKTLLRLYIREVSELSRRLTFDGVLEKIEHIAHRLENTLNPVQRVLDQQQPYRREGSEKKVLYVEVNDEGYHGAGELISDLLDVRSIIVERHRGLFVELLDRLIYKVRCFGFHFASLDVRQDSSVHSDVIARLLPADSRISDMADNYLELDEDRRIEILENAADRVSRMGTLDRQQLFVDLLDRLTDEVERDCLMSFRVIAEIQSRNGEIGAHRYIVSHSERASHILEVWLLALISGFDPDLLPIDFIPLFETIEDLHNAPRIIRTLFASRAYRAQVEQRGDRQHIMLGFSDGTKDGGYVTANWEIYRAKEALTAACAEHGIRALFFDGRGGPPARGGGNTHKFYRSLGKDIDSRCIQLTLQGQTISSSYGTPAMANYNLGQIVSAGLDNNLFPSEGSELGPEDRNLIERLSTIANRKYLELRNHPRFIPYLEHMTPLKYYGRTNIGSRPSRRNAALSLDSLRAIPFVGAWSQMKQNVPGYYGLGSALKELADEGFEEALRMLYHRNLFFRTLMENSMQSLSKSYFPLTSYLQADTEYGDFYGIIRDEAKLSADMLGRITGQTRLLDSDPVVRESIRLRETMILPVTVIQQYALQKIRQLDAMSPGQKLLYVDADRERQREILEKLIIKSLMASINASRNSV
jgi:phosphoenolpyruvate carboxylase